MKRGQFRGYYNNAPPFTIGETYHFQLCGSDKTLRGKNMIYIGSLDLERATIPELDGKFPVDLFAYSENRKDILFLAIRNGLINEPSPKKIVCF